MRVLLAKPTVKPEHYYGKSKGLMLVENFIPSLGLGYLAAVLVENGRDVKIHDPVLPQGVEPIAAAVEEWRPDVLGLSVFTPHVASLPHLFELLERISHRPFIVMGGSHVSALPLESMDKYPADLCVVGEGEMTLLEIIGRLDSGDRDLRNIPGTVYRESGESRLAQARPYIEDLDRLPFPARDLMPPLSEHRPTPVSLRRKPLGSMITSRGCPHKCTFCDRSVFGRYYRCRTPENVIAEMRELTDKYGAREIRFFDDDLAIDRERAVELARLIFKERKVPWSCFLSARNADLELLQLFRNAGCWQVLMGLESGVDSVLRRLKKPTTLKLSRQAVNNANRAGLRIRADFISGTPGETIDEMWETFRFAKQLKIDFAHFCKFLPYPGSEIHANLAAAGHKFDYEANWSDSDNSSTQYVPDGIDPDDYARFLDRAYKRSYFRPGFVLRRLLRIRSLTELGGHIKGFLAALLL